MINGATRENVFEYVLSEYGTTPEYLWAKTPFHAVLRRSDNNKWYGIVMGITRDKLGLDSVEYCDVINVKCSPLMTGSLLLNSGFFPAYHMNKLNWVSVILDGTVPLDEVINVIDLSFEMTASKIKAKKDKK